MHFKKRKRGISKRYAYNNLISRAFKEKDLEEKAYIAFFINKSLYFKKH